MKKSQHREQNTRSSSGLSDDISLQQQRKRKFLIKQSICVLYYVSRITLTILLLYYLSHNYISQLSLTSSYLRIQQNINLWKQDVITNITLVNSYNCPEGFQTYTAYNWPGIKEGCYCYTQIGTWDFIKVLEGPCTALAAGAGCKIVPQQLQNWLICLKRVKNLNFFTNLDQLRIPSSTCSPSLPYQFNIPSSLPTCPITTLTNNPTLPNLLPQINFSFSRSDSYPISTIKMTQYQFCQDFNRDNISPGKERNTNYVLDRRGRTFCEGKDWRVVEIDEQGELQLISSNPRIQNIVTMLPAYPQPSNDYVYKLGFIRYPQWTYSCRKSSQFNLIQAQSYLNLQQSLSLSENYINIVLILSSIYGFIFTLIYIYQKCSQLYYKHQHSLLYHSIKQVQTKKPNLYQKIKKQLKIQLTLFCTKIILSLIILILLVVLYTTLIQHYQWFMKSRNCMGDVMWGWVQSYMRFWEDQQATLLLAIVILVTLVAVDACMFCWRTWKQRLNQHRGQSVSNIFDQQINQKTVENRTCDEDITQNNIQHEMNKRNDTNEYIFTQDNLIQVSQAQFSNSKAGKRRLSKPRTISINDITSQSQY